jgi:hypothetical protein
MSIFRVIGMTLFIIGVVLLVMGIIATQSTGEKVFGEVSGHYTNTTMWYIIGGIALIAGGYGITRIKR